MPDSVLAPMSQEMQARLRALGANDEQIVRLNTLVMQRGIDFDTLCTVLAKHPPGYLEDLLAVFVPQMVPPIHPGS